MLNNLRMWNSKYKIFSKTMASIIFKNSLNYPLYPLHSCLGTWWHFFLSSCTHCSVGTLEHFLSGTDLQYGTLTGKHFLDGTAWHSDLQKIVEFKIRILSDLGRFMHIFLATVWQTGTLTSLGTGVQFVVGTFKDISFSRASDWPLTSRQIWLVTGEQCWLVIGWHTSMGTEWHLCLGTLWHSCNRAGPSDWSALKPLIGHWPD